MSRSLTDTIVRGSEQKILDDLRSGKSVLLLGPRRTGKTTVLRRIQVALASDFQVLLLDCRITDTVASLYQALNQTVLREVESEAMAREYAFLTDLSGRLLDLVHDYRDYQSHTLDEASLVKQLYAVQEHIDRRNGTDTSTHFHDGLLAEAVRLRANGPDGDAETVSSLQGLVAQVAQLPREKWPQAVVGDGDGNRLIPRILPLLLFRIGRLSDTELMRDLLESLTHTDVPTRRPLLLFDEAHALSGPEFRAFFSTLREAEGPSFVLCADGLAGELLAMVQEIGPARRHPFLHVEDEQRITVRYMGPLIQPDVARLAEEQLDQAGLSAVGGTFEAIGEHTGGLPYYVRHLVRLCVDEARATGSELVTPQLVESAATRLVEEKDPDYAALFEVQSPLQRVILLRVASAEGRGRLEKVDEQVADALDGLAQRFLIERISEQHWRVADAVFRAWLLRLAMSA